jgi:hypothetical protein
MSLSSTCAFSAAAMALAGLTVAACDAHLARPASREKVEMAQVPEPVRRTIARQSQGAVLNEIEKKVQAGKELYLASLAGKDSEEKLLIDVRGKVVGRLRGDYGARAAIPVDASTLTTNREWLALHDARCTTSAN